MHQSGRGVERLHSSFLFGKREDDNDDDDVNDDDNTGSTKAILTFVVFFWSSRVSTHKRIHSGEKTSQKSSVLKEETLGFKESLLGILLVLRNERETR